MSQPKAPTTEIKPEKPLVVQTYTPPYILKGLSDFAQATAQRSAVAEARANRAIDSLVGREPTPTLDFEGNPIATNVIPKPFDGSVFFDPSKNPLLQQGIDEYVEENERRRRRKERMEKMDEVDKIFGMPRESYLAAMNRVANQGRSS